MYNTMDALTNFVDQLRAPEFPTLERFNSSLTSGALKWTDVVQDTVYQIVSTHNVNTQHGASIKTQDCSRFCSSYFIQQKKK